MLRADESNIVAMLLASMTPAAGTLAELAFTALLAIAWALIVRRDATTGMTLRHLVVSERTIDIAVGRPAEITHVIITTHSATIETVLAVLAMLNVLTTVMLGIAIILGRSEINGNKRPAGNLLPRACYT